jgi:hypothetical protein
MRRLFAAALCSLGIAVCAASAQAIPVMQIYIDGATFDPQSQTWVATQPDFDLWVLGDIAQFGTIYEVKLTATFFGLGPGSMTITPVTTSTITDPSTPPAPAFLRTGTGGHPVLPAHGIFNDPTMNHWDDYVLGDFTLMDSPIGDFNGATPFPASFPDLGQVNVYHVHMEGWAKVHFDAYDHTVNSLNGKETYWKSPFSHDGQVGVASMSWAGVKALFH